MAKNIVTKVDAQYIYDMAEAEGFSVSETKGYYTIEDDNFKVYISTGSTYNSKKVRIYTEGYEDVDFSEAYAMQEDGVGVRRGENEEIDKAFDRLNRQAVKNKKAVIDEAIATNSVVRALLGNAKYGFWKTAGCSCGCSAGHIADAYPRLRRIGFYGVSAVEDIRIVKK